MASSTSVAGVRLSKAGAKQESKHSNVVAERMTLAKLTEMAASPHDFKAVLSEMSSFALNKLIEPDFEVLKDIHHSENNGVPRITTKRYTDTIFCVVAENQMEAVPIWFEKLHPIVVKEICANKALPRLDTVESYALNLSIKYHKVEGGLFKSTLKMLTDILCFVRESEFLFEDKREKFFNFLHQWIPENLQEINFPQELLAIIKRVEVFIQQRQIRLSLEEAKALIHYKVRLCLVWAEQKPEGTVALEDELKNAADPKILTTVASMEVALIFGARVHDKSLLLSQRQQCELYYLTYLTATIEQNIEAIPVKISEEKEAKDVEQVRGRLKFYKDEMIALKSKIIISRLLEEGEILTNSPHGVRKFSESSSSAKGCFARIKEPLEQENFLLANERVDKILTQSRALLPRDFLQWIGKLKPEIERRKSAEPVVTLRLSQTAAM